MVSRPKNTPAGEFLQSAASTTQVPTLLRRASYYKSGKHWVEHECSVVLNKPRPLQLHPGTDRVATIFGETLWRRRSRHSLPQPESHRDVENWQRKLHVANAWHG